MSELGYTHVGASGHPNDKHTLVDGHAQSRLGEEPGIQLHAGPLCAYPSTEEWHTARFDDEGRYDEQKGLDLPAAGSYQVWGSMIQDGEVLVGGDPVEDALILQSYVRNFYPFPDAMDPILVEVPIVCCHHYDSAIYVNESTQVDDLVYFVTVSSEQTGDVFYEGPAPFSFEGEELTEWLGPRFVDTLIIEITSPQPDAPPPTLGHWIVVEINVPDDTWPGSAPDPAPGSDRDP